MSEVAVPASGVAATANITRSHRSTCTSASTTISSRKRHDHILELVHDRQNGDDAGHASGCDLYRPDAEPDARAIAGRDGKQVDRFIFFFQAEDGIRVDLVTGVQTCALPIFHVVQT